MPRRARLILCTSDGDVLGGLPPVEVDSPWWPDVEPVVASVRHAHGIDVVVLRLLETTASAACMGGDVTYLAEVAGPMPPSTMLDPVLDAQGLEEDELRAPYARPKGLARILAWADAELARHGSPRLGPPVQVKTWNLSSVLRLPTADGQVWCKTVPPFLAHEGPTIDLVGSVDRTLVPPLLGHDAATRSALLGDVPGDDLFTADGDQLLAMVTRLVRLQVQLADRVDDLLGTGLPDRRGPALTARLATLLQRPEVRSQVDPEHLARADRLVAGLADRFAALADCGIPETLIHGDFHPGNWRSDGRSMVLLDWGDSAVAHPLLDATAFLPRVPGEARPAIQAAWAETWERAVPGCDPYRALDLVLPIGALRQALMYQMFLDGIERTERRYHEDDVASWIGRAVAATSGR